MSKQIFPPDLTDVLENMSKEIFKTLNCVQIGEIQSYDTDNQTATVKLVIKQVLTETVDGVKTLQDHPLLLECPCMVLTGGSAYLSMPISAGDSCLVLFNDRDIDNWFKDGLEAPPNTYRRHDYSDGLAIVGVRNEKNAITSYLTDGVRLRLNTNDLMQIRPANVLIQTLTSSINLITNAINSIATLWTHTGSMLITNGLAVYGTVTGTAGGTLTINTDIAHTGDQDTSGELRGGSVRSDDGWTGTFATGDSRTVTVNAGIITNVS